jgi:hypothetical protein
MTIRKGRFIWPGIASPVEGTYTISQGITPGVACLKCNPQGNFAETGDLIITDDVAKIVIPDCKVDRVRQEYDRRGGYIWIVEILDWRWKWRDLGGIFGLYNQLDNHGKLIPWTIRSPYELTRLCLEEMGVTKYEIDMPAGLTRADGEKHQTLNPPWIGVVPTTGTNPPVQWIGVPPAQALESLCNQFGRRVVPRLSDYTITIVKPGIGGPLPPGSISKQSPGLDSPETPLGVAVVGDPTRYQARLRLEAVAEEWDGSYRPIDQVSYAPLHAEQNQVFTIRIGTPQVNKTVSVTISKGLKSATYSHTIAAGETKAVILADLVTSINAGILSTSVVAAASSPNLTLTGATSSTEFEVSVTSNGTTSFRIATRQYSCDGKPSWVRSSPPVFANLGNVSRTIDEFNTVTPRLTFTQALNLAQRSVFKCYRIADVDAGAPIITDDHNSVKQKDASKIKIPGYGELVRRQQIVLQETKVEQVTPEPQMLNTLDLNGLPAVVNFYNGYSRDKPAAVTGSVSRYLNFTLHNQGVGANTAEADQVHVPFRVDPVNQLIIFSSPVFATDGYRVVAPKLILETGVLIHDAETNELARYRAVSLNAAAKGITNLLVRHHPDVQLNLIGQYDSDNKILGVQLLEQDAINRANHYLQGMKIQYFPTASEIREYNGFMGINLDGAVRQVTWDFGPRGCKTTAGLNTEHSIYVPPYPQRRRREFLSPAVLDNGNNAAGRVRGKMWEWEP